MAHVTINDINPLIAYSPTTGTSYTIPSTWGWFNLTDFKVYSGTTELSYAATPTTSTQFATTGTLIDGGYNGGSVVLGAASTQNNIIISRNVPDARTSDFPYPSATINIKTLNTDLDKIVAVQQQFDRDLEKTIRLADGDTSTVGTIGSASARASKFLYFDSTGGATVAGLTLSGTTVSVSAFMLTVLDDASAADVRTSLGSAIGSDVQIYNADLTDLAASRLIGRGSASSGAAEDLTLDARLTMSGTTLTITAPLTVATGGTSATTSSGAVANLNISYDFAFNAGFSSTGGTANIVAQTYGEVISGRNVTALSEQGYITTAGSTQAVIVDIEVNGTTIYSTKPQFGTTNALTAGTLSNSTISAGDRVTFKVTQIGSTGTPGAGLRFTLLSKMRV